MIEWLFSPTDMPNYAMVIVCFIGVAGVLCLNYASDRLKRSTNLLYEVREMLSDHAKDFYDMDEGR